MERIHDHFNKEAEKHDSYFIDVLGLKEFYDEIEVQLNRCDQSEKILVLGCGSGLEIERIHSKSQVTAVDISENMIKKLKEKKLHDQVDLETICGSFLDVDFGAHTYDIVLTCYAMHHFKEDQKLSLYRNIYKALRPGGVFINGDSMARDSEEEKERFNQANIVYTQMNMPFGSLHIDSHFCYEHELEVLALAGFEDVILEREWKKTKLYRAIK